MKPAATLIPVLAATTLLLPHRAGADPRDIAGPPEPVTPEMIEARRQQKAADVAALLPRLAGRFDVEGTAGLQAARGKADCVAIGSGPGVHCVFHVVWGQKQQGQGASVRRGSSFLAPAAFLFGFDPREGLVRTLQLDTSGVAEDMMTNLNNSTLTWCKGEKGDWCYRAYAPEDDGSIQITLYLGDAKFPVVNLHLDRSVE